MIGKYIQLSQTPLRMRKTLVSTPHLVAEKLHSPFSTLSLLRTKYFEVSPIGKLKNNAV